MGAEQSGHWWKVVLKEQTKYLAQFFSRDMVTISSFFEVLEELFVQVILYIDL